MRLLPLPLAGLLVLAAPFALPAQVRPAAARDSVASAADVPKSMRPPPGKCRVWISGVPAKQQPAPTDCATALRQNPTNGIVLYGPPLNARSDTVRSPRATTEKRVAPKPVPERKPPEPPKKKPERP